MADPILDDLNPQQRAAVVHGEGPLMVLAGAGSGKTRVVTRRIAYLLREGVRPGNVLGLTFTNKAAQEMARRVQELGQPWVRIATFHSACARFLRRHASRLDYPADFSIYDTYDRNSCLKGLMEERGLDRFGIKPSQVGSLISRLKNLQVGPDDFTRGSSDLHLIVEEVYRPYEERMHKLGAMDFDDLLLKFVALLRAHPDVAAEYRERYPWILIDEFQDTNRVQYDMLRLLTEPTSNLCVVGDPDQSIYAFRGAEIRNILDFEEDYPDTVITRLEQNYRSTKTILRAAEQVIANNVQRKHKSLHTDNEAGDPLTRFRAAGPAEEASEIAVQIRGLLDEGVPHDEIAVFYRAHYLSRALEEALKTEGIPYRIVGGLTFFERREIKDLLAYLRVLINPLDDISMERIVNVPPRRIGKATLAALRRAAAGAGASLFEVVLDPELRQGLSAQASRSLDALGGTLRQARDAARVGAHPALQVILEGTHYLDYACGLGDPEDITREENIQELVGNTVLFDQEVGEGLAGYLQHVSLLTSADRGDDDEPRVTLMTVHAAKGLEFDHVFIAGLDEGVFPSARALEENALEEERRLMYVALTRGRKSVWLSHCRERMVAGRMERASPSRFLEEIPPDCLVEHEQGWKNWEEEGDGFDPDPDFADAQELAELRVGARVEHREFGQGVVTRLTGHGMVARAIVLFADGSERVLILEYGGLRLLSEGGQW